MATSARKNLKTVFWIIAVIASLGAITIGVWSSKLAFPYWQSLFITIPLVLEALGTAGINYHWFIRAGRIVDTLQWVAGILGTLAIFDLVMRLMRRGAWMLDSGAPIIFDAILILLFVLWMVVSHLIHEDAIKRKVCDFC